MEVVRENQETQEALLALFLGTLCKFKDHSIIVITIDHKVHFQITTQIFRRVDQKER